LFIIVIYIQKNCIIILQTQTIYYPQTTNKHNQKQNAAGRNSDSRPGFPSSLFYFMLYFEHRHVRATSVNSYEYIFNLVPIPSRWYKLLYVSIYLLV